MNFATKKNFEKLDYSQKESILRCQNLIWFERKDFEKLNDHLKEYVLGCQNFIWFERKDFEKLNDRQKQFALKCQNLSWFERKDFEELNDNQKGYALGYQNLSWFERKDFKKLTCDQKQFALKCQNLSWFTKKILGVLYKIHKKRTKKQCLKEMEDYAKLYDLTFDGKYLFAFREHDKFGRGQFNGTIFYKNGKYYKDWHLNADEIDQNSFGLGIFPKGNTPVKVHVNDWGCSIPSTNKCRVWGFTIL